MGKLIAFDPSLTLAVGIDPSLTCTAMVCLPGVGPVPLRFSKGDNLSRVIKYARMVSRELWGAMELHSELSNVVVCIEAPHANLKGNSLWLLPLFWRIMEELLEYSNAAVYSVAPATLKKFATGKGNAKKTMVGQAVERHWGTELPAEFFTDDEADAFALAKMARCIINPGGDWTAYQSECAGKLKRYQIEKAM